MRICILSMQRVDNFGSLLQGYALKKMLEGCGHSVRFLDIERIDEDDRLKSVNAVHRGSMVGKVVSRLQKLDRYALNRLRIKRIHGKQLAMLEDFRREKLEIRGNENNGEYDVCVIGSDEVFNCMTVSNWGFTSQLFGNVRQAERVMTYAASCGATTYGDLPAGVADRIREVFRRVSAFSVRDENTLEFVSRLTDQKAEIYLDPVMVGDFEGEIESAALPEDLPERYCVVYSYYNRISDPDEISRIRSFCRNHGLTPIAVGTPQMWLRQYPVMDPFQVLKVFRNAEFIITDTFHGTIFSARFGKRFAVTTRPSNENKLGDLIRRLGLERHRVTGFEQLEDVFGVENDLQRIRDLLGPERERTMEYLWDHTWQTEG